MMINEAETVRRFRNLVSTAQLVKQMKRYGYEGEYTEEAIYKLFEKYGLTAKARRGGKAYFNRNNAFTCIERHIFELREIAEKLKEKHAAAANKKVEPDEEQVGYGRDDMDDMDIVSMELLANDGVFGADVNDLYRTNENRFSFKNIVKEILNKKRP